MARGADMAAAQNARTNPRGYFSTVTVIFFEITAG
jgi:hypothetical protein